MSNDLTVRPPQAPTSFDEMQKIATAIAKSNLFGMKTSDQALALMAIAQAEGYPAALAARDYHVIQGRPTLKADAMLARFQQAGGKVEWHSYTDEKVEATFSHPQGGSVKVDWTMERAQKAGLHEKDNWRGYPRAMMRARVISEGVRTVWPGVTVGLYTPEEIQDLPENDPRVIQGQYEHVQDPQSPSTDPRGAEFAGEPIATDPVAAQQSSTASNPIPGARYHAKSGERLASEAQIELIRKKAMEKGLTKNEIYSQLHIQQSLTEELLFNEVTEVLKWLSEIKDANDKDIPY